MKQYLIGQMMNLPSFSEQAAKDAKNLVRAMGLTDIHGAPMVEAAYCRACKALLSQVDRPETQAWMLREIARFLGWEIGVRVPMLTRCPLQATDYAVWELVDRTSGRHVLFATHQIVRAGHVPSLSPDLQDNEEDRPEVMIRILLQVSILGWIASKETR